LGDATDLYVLSACGVQRVSTTSGALTTLTGGFFATESPAIALDDTKVFVGSDEGLRSVPKNGGTPTTLVNLEVTAVAVDGNDVYFARRPTWDPVAQGYSNDAAVYVIDKSGGTATELATKTGFVTAMAAHDGQVYFGSGKLSSVPKTGGPTTKLVPSIYTRSIRLRNGSIVMGLDTAGAATFALPSGPFQKWDIPMTVASDQVVGADIDDQRIFFTLLDRIFVADLSDPDPTHAKLVSESVSFSTYADVYVDEQRVYWAMSDDPFTEDVNESCIRYLEKP
jgi:hypothetical protein